MSELSHLDESGGARMVDVGEKSVTRRRAVARGEVHLPSETLRLLCEKALPKGDVLTVAQVAGIQAAKRTADLIPMCHNVTLSKVSVALQVTEYGVLVTGEAIGEARTGFEMEALTAVAVAALTLYDMTKSVSQDIRITNIELVEKSGGKSDIAR